LSGLSLDASGNAMLAGSKVPHYGEISPGGDLLLDVIHTGGTSAGPAISAGGIVEIFTYTKERAAPGSIEAVFGTNLATATAQANAIPLPTSLGGASVTVNGTAAPLFFASPGQINFQVPWETSTGVGQVVVQTLAGSSPPAAMLVNISAPTILVASNTNRAVAVNQDGSLNSSSNPIPSGQFFTVFLIGQGAVMNGPATGAATQGPAAAMAAASAAIGPASARLLYVGLTPGFVGLAQASLETPPLASGDYSVTITVNGITSNAAIVSVRGQ
jgi:adhesin/invasin